MTIDAFSDSARRRQVVALEGIGITGTLRGMKDAAPGHQITCTAKVGDPGIVILRDATAWEPGFFISA